MPDFCSGGASRPRTGQNEFVVLFTDNLVSLVNGGGFPWIANYVGALTGRSFHLPTFCATPAPDLPTVDGARVASWFLPPDGAVKLREDMEALVGYLFWLAACECTATGPVTPPTPPPQPPNVTINPPSIVPPVGGTPCGSSTTWLEGMGFTAGVPHVSTFQNWRPPVGTTSGKMVWQGRQNTQGGPVTYPITISLGAVNAAGTVLGTTTFVQTVEHVNLHTDELSVPPGTDHFVHTVTATTGCTGLCYTIAATPTWYCDGQPPIDPIVPCCPPDPVLQQLLYQIIAMLQALATPGASSWTDGPRHTSLRESGRIVLGANAIGVRVEATSMPPGLSTIPGNPTFFWDAGFITPLALDIPLRGQRLVFNPQSFALPAQADGVAWTVPEGLVFDLVELLPA